MSHPLGKLCFPFIVCKPHATNQRKHTFPKEQELVIPLFSAFPRMLSLLVKKVHLIWRALAPSSGVQCSSQWESEQRRNPFQVSQHTRRRRCLEDIVLAHSCELRCSWIDSRRRCVCGRRPKGVDEKVPITSKLRELCLFLVCHYYGEEKKGTWNAIYIMTTAFLFQSQYAFCKLQFVLAGGSVPRDFFLTSRHRHASVPTPPSPGFRGRRAQPSRCAVTAWTCFLLVPLGSFLIVLLFRIQYVEFLVFKVFSS